MIWYMGGLPMSSAARVTRRVTGALVLAALVQRGVYQLGTPRKLPSGCVLDYVNAGGANHNGLNMNGDAQIKANCYLVSFVWLE